MDTNVKRGEIYLYDFGTNEGSIQNGLRPALVVQCDEGNKASCTTVIAAMTTVIKKRYLPSHIILGDRFGLKEPSMVMLEQLRTVNQRRFYLHTHSGIIFRTLSFSRMTDFRGRPSTDRVSSKWRTWWNRAW